MAFQLPTDGCLLFQGDSITAAKRDPGDSSDLGHGFVSRIAHTLAGTRPDLRVVNRGISGDRAADLARRWQEDTLTQRPDLVSVLVGVNDTWRRFDRDDPTSTDAYERSYRDVLARSAKQGSLLVLVEPFLLPVRAQQWAWREDLDRRISVVRRLTEEFDAQLLAADGLLNQAARTHGAPSALTTDGVHLTETGHDVLASAWLALTTAS
ncbi:SGNH/GDSL hydrolase family protein [Streptomyces sp. NPDC050400]|uniref:SGNH/GDSL hydrolase family protein n=1 Tax=Streptomyces sp. NPDC050400 TaxID=3365610 RepID=UPI003790DC57